MPLIEEASKKYEGKIKVGKVKVDNAKNKSVVATNEIPGTPRIIFYYKGKKVSRSGVLDKEALSKKCEAILSKYK